MKTFVCILIIFISGLYLGMQLQRCQEGDHSTEKESTDKLTVVITDSMKVQSPVATNLSIGGTKQFQLPRYCIVKIGDGISNSNCLETDDTLSEATFDSVSESADSLAVNLPIFQRHYQDSTYEAWVSGPLDPRLDSIVVFNRRELTTIRHPPDRWHIGVTAGWGMTPMGMQPYIGIGLTYSFISF